MNELRCHCGEGPFANGAELQVHQDKAHSESPQIEKAEALGIPKEAEKVTLEEPRVEESRSRVGRKGRKDDKS